MKIIWAGVLGIAIWFATDRTLAAADKADVWDAEKAQIEKEAAAEQAERDRGIKGKWQRLFRGTVYLLTQANEELSPDVVGYFVTNGQDRRPGRNYLMKLGGNDKKALADALKKVNGMTVQIRGVLRVIGENGEAKYLIVDSVWLEGPTPTVPERRSGSGL